MEFEFKKITSHEDLGRLTELMYLCFGLKVDDSYFKWKYFDNPAGQAIVYEALYNGKTVGSYGIIPEFYWIDGVVKKTYQAVEAMTHPNFQRKGLFVKLAQLVLQDSLQQNKEILMIAFPGAQSIGGFINKLNWKLINNCNYIFLPNFLFKLKNHNKSNTDFHIVKFNEANDMLLNYLEATQPHTKISKVINKEIFRWKILDNPRLKYNTIGIVNNSELIGISVYRVDYQNTCLINWLHFNDEPNYKIYTPIFLQHIFKETNIKYIYTWNSKSEPLSQAYEKCGFITNPFNLGPFHSKLPFAIYQQGFSKDNGLQIFKNYDFQPIILD
jgi:hypothetical protein